MHAGRNEPIVIKSFLIIEDQLKRKRKKKKKKIYIYIYIYIPQYLFDLPAAKMIG